MMINTLIIFPRNLNHPMDVLQKNPMEFIISHGVHNMQNKRKMTGLVWIWDLNASIFFFLINFFFELCELLVKSSYNLKKKFFKKILTFKFKDRTNPVKVKLPDFKISFKELYFKNSNLYASCICDCN